MKSSKALLSSERMDQFRDGSVLPALREIIARARSISNDRMLRMPHVRAKSGRGSSTIWKDVKEGTLPPPVAIGKRSVAWKESEIQACMDARVLASRTHTAIDMKWFVEMLLAPSDSSHKSIQI